MRPRTYLLAGGAIAGVFYALIALQPSRAERAGARAEPSSAELAPLPPPSVVAPTARASAIAAATAPAIAVAAAPSAAPGTYVPKSFDPHFRERIVADFANVIDQKLGANFPKEKRDAIAAAQNRYWDVLGPSVDAFESGKITQLEYADRTRQALGAYAKDLAGILTDDEYLKLMDSPKGMDPYPLLYHSESEQPGMPMRPYDGDPAHPEPSAAVGPPPGHPPPAAFKDPSPKVVTPPAPGTPKK